MMAENFGHLFWAMRPDYCKNGSDTPPKLGELSFSRAIFLKSHETVRRKSKEHKRQRS